MKQCAKCSFYSDDSSAFCSNCGAPMNQANTIQDRNQQKKDSKTKKTVAVILIIVIILLSCAIGFAVYINKNNDEKEKAALRKAVEEYTTKQLLDFYYDDYDADGKNEAFAIAGDGDKDEFQKADIIYVDRKKKPKTVDSDISGHTNGMIYDGNTKFVSVEKETEKAEDNRSFVYGVKEEDAYQPEISGEYRNIHQDGEDIRAQLPDSDEEIQLTVDDSGELTAFERSWGTAAKSAEKSDNQTAAPAANIKTALDPTNTDWRQIEDIMSTIISDLSGSNGFDKGEIYNCNTFPADMALGRIAIGQFSVLYWTLFGEEEIEGLDPLGKSSPPDTYDASKWSGYEKYSEKNVRFIMENVLNIKDYTPPAEKQIITIDNEFDQYYLCDGYYYRETIDAGMLDPSCSVSGKTLLGDSRYNVKISYGYEDLNKNYLNVLAEVKEIDGFRFWSIYTIEAL